MRLETAPSMSATELPAEASQEAVPRVAGASVADEHAPLAGLAGHGAIEAAYDRCAVGLFRYVFVRVGRDRDATDDLMQQLWLAALKNAAGVGPDGFEFWLRSVAGRLIADHFRKAYRRGGSKRARVFDPAQTAGLAQRLQTEQVSAEALADQDLKDQLALAITELSAQEQQLVLDHYVRERTHAEIAAEQGVSQRSIEGRLYRARRSLLDRLRHWLRPQEQTETERTWP